jgi:hypothetical protein
VERRGLLFLVGCAGTDEGGGMKRSEIYREAARQVCAAGPDMQAYSCAWIEEIAGADCELATSCVKAYTSLFAPLNGDLDPRCMARYAWGVHWDWPTHDQVNNCRILALLFMAAISESEGM